MDEPLPSKRAVPAARSWLSRQDNDADGAATSSPNDVRTAVTASLLSAATAARHDHNSAAE